MTDAPTPSIPPAPRIVRRDAVITHRLGLLITGVVLMFGGAVLLLTTDHAARFDDLALDAEGARTNGRVEASEVWSATRSRLTVAFTVDTHTYTAQCFGAATDTRTPGLLVGGPCTVEFLPRRPDIARALDTTRASAGRWPSWLPAQLPGSGVAIGVALCLLWLRAGTDRRLLLRDGRAVPAEVLRVQPTWWRRLVRVEFQFRDREQRRRLGRVTCLASSAVATAANDTAANDTGSLIVVHPHAHPERHCVTTRATFEA